MGDNGRDILDTSESGRGPRAPRWLRRAFLGLAVLGIVALAGRELLVGGPSDDPEPQPSPPSATRPLPGPPQSSGSGATDSPWRLVGTIDGRIARVLPGGSVEAGLRVSRLRPHGGGPPGDPWRHGLALVHHDGRVLYVADGKLRVTAADLSGPPRTVTDARGVLPCEGTQACVVTKSGAVARVRLSDGKVLEPEVVPKEAYADGLWRPRAVLRGGIVLTRPAPEGPGSALGREDVAVTTEWEDTLMLDRGVELLGAHGSQIVTWDTESGASRLTSYVLNGPGRSLGSSTVTPPAGWRFLPDPIGFTGSSPAAVAYVVRGGEHALALIELYGGDGSAPLVPGTLGADPNAGIAISSATGSVVFGVNTGEERRFALLSTRTPSRQPARLLPSAIPSSLYVGGLLFCPQPGETCTA